MKPKMGALTSRRESDSVNGINAGASFPSGLMSGRGDSSSTNSSVFWEDVSGLLGECLILLLISKDCRVQNGS